MVLPAASGRLPIWIAAAIAAPEEIPPGMPSVRASAREVSIAVALVVFGVVSQSAAAALFYRLRKPLAAARIANSWQP